MREIKFRMWNFEEKKMIYPTIEFNERYILQLNCTYKGEFNGKRYNSIQLPIMQYTGLADKNGVEIYEGDYLVDRYPVDETNLELGYHESLLPVVWCEKSLQWCVDSSFKKDGSYLTSLVEYFKELEVKGNIYENN